MTGWAASSFAILGVGGSSASWGCDGLPCFQVLHLLGYVELWLLRNTNVQFKYIKQSILICHKVSILNINFQITFFKRTSETFVWLCCGLQQADFTELNVMLQKWKMMEFGVCEIWVSHCGVAEDASILVIFHELLDTEDVGCVIFPKCKNFSPDMASHPRRSLSFPRCWRKVWCCRKCEQI